MLLNHGARIEARSSRGETALAVAKRRMALAETGPSLETFEAARRCVAQLEEAEAVAQVERPVAVLGGFFQAHVSPSQAKSSSITYRKQVCPSSGNGDVNKMVLTAGVGTAAGIDMDMDLEESATEGSARAATSERPSQPVGGVETEAQPQAHISLSRHCDQATRSTGSCHAVDATAEDRFWEMPFCA